MVTTRALSMRIANKIAKAREKKGCGLLLLKHFGCNVNCGDFFLGKIRLCLACSGKIKELKHTQSGSKD